MERWPQATGRAVHESYGMTETIEIVDLATGTELLPPGAPGEVRIRGPHMMTGYHGNLPETAITLRDGYIYIGHLDPDGVPFITDRNRNMVFVKGFNVYPRQVEEVL